MGARSVITSGVVGASASGLFGHDSFHNFVTVNHQHSRVGFQDTVGRQRYLSGIDGVAHLQVANDNRNRRGNFHDRAFDFKVVHQFIKDAAVCGAFGLAAKLQGNFYDNPFVQINTNKVGVNHFVAQIIILQVF